MTSTCLAALDSTYTNPLAIIAGLGLIMVTRMKSLGLDSSKWQWLDSAVGLFFACIRNFCFSFPTLFFIAGNQVRNICGRIVHGRMALTFFALRIL